MQAMTLAFNCDVAKTLRRASVVVPNTLSKIVIAFAKSNAVIPNTFSRTIIAFAKIPFNRTNTHNSFLLALPLKST